MKHVFQECFEMIRPARGDHARPDCIFENQVPANNPRHQLAHRSVRVCIGTSGDRHHARELGIAERRKPAADGGDEKRDHERGTCKLLGDKSRLHIEPGANRGPDAQPHERDGPEPPIEPLARIHLVDQMADVFPPKKTGRKQSHSKRPRVS